MAAMRRRSLASVTHVDRISTSLCRAATTLSESLAAGVGLGGAPMSEWWEPSVILSTIREGERLCNTDCEDHGSRSPLEKITCDVEAAILSGPPAMPMAMGSHAGRGRTLNRLLQVLDRPASDQGCGGKQSLTLLAPIG